MEKHPPDARGQEALDGLIGVLGRGVVVTPVAQCRRAAIDLVHGPHQGCNVEVLWRVVCGQPGVHIGEVFQDGPIAADTSQGSLPRVHVRIDKARCHDHAGGIDRLGFGC